MKIESESLKLDLKAAETVPLDGLTRAQLEELVHCLTAKRIVEGLRSAEVSPQHLAQSLRFLEQNKISGLDLPGTATADVAEAFKAKLPFKLAN